MATHTETWDTDAYDGLMDWLGKNKGVDSWAHPETSRSLVVTSQSSTLSGMTSDRALNQSTSTSTGRSHTNTDHFAWWQVKLVDAVITPTHFAVRSQNHSNGMDTFFNIEGSLDGVSWDVLAQTPTKVSNNNWYSVAVSGASAYQYFRIMRYQYSAHLIIGEFEVWGEYDDDVPDADYGGEAEFAYNSEGGHNGLIQWLGSDKDFDNGYLNPDTNSGDGIDRITASLSSQLSSYYPYNVFNRSAADAARAHTNNVSDSWLKFDLLSGNTFIPSGVAMQAALSSGSTELRNFVIEGSNDDSNWTELYDVPDGSTGPQNAYGWFVADLSTVTEAYRYIRIRQYGTNDEGTNYLSSAEIELYGTFNPSSVTEHTAVGTTTGTGSMTGTGTWVAFADATLSGTGSMSASSTRSTFSTGTITSSGSMSADATRSTFSTATVTGTGSMSGTGTWVAFADGSITGAGTITGSATVSGVTVHDAVGAITGNGSLSGSAVCSTFGVGTSTGTGTFTASGVLTSFVSGTLTGAATVAADATRVTFGTATITGTSTLSGSSQSFTPSDAFSFESSMVVTQEESVPSVGEHGAGLVVSQESGSMTVSS